MRSAASKIRQPVVDRGGHHRAHRQRTAEHPQAGGPPRRDGGEVTGVRGPVRVDRRREARRRPGGQRPGPGGVEPAYDRGPVDRSGDSSARGSTGEHRLRERRRRHRRGGRRGARATTRQPRHPLRQQQDPDQPGRREQQRLQAPGRWPVVPGRDATARVGPAESDLSAAVRPATRGRPRARCRARAGRSRFGAGRGEQRQQPVRRCRRPGLPPGPTRPDDRRGDGAVRRARPPRPGPPE